jgi:DNA adenine methylase
MNFYSPLRYPGGKGKIANYFKQVFKDNSLYDGVYIEPYAGGASVALSLLFNQYASRIIINDIDRAIYAFWYSVLNKTEKLCQLINNTPLNIDTWKEQKQIQKEKSTQDLLALGFSTFYLNRTNRSGILNAGIIGGIQQKGKWKMNARYTKDDLILRIKRIAQYRDSIQLYNSDAIQLVKSLVTRLPEKSLFYFDPPYYVKGKDLYLSFYKANDHLHIANQISKINRQKWIVTYDNVEPICNLYSDFRQSQFKLSYSAGKANREGSEVMIYSDNIKIPQNPIKQ